MKKNNDSTGVKIKGDHYRFWINEKVKEGTSQFKQLQYAIQQFVKRGRADLLTLYADQGLLRFDGLQENLLANTGKEIFSRLLVGSGVYTGQINYGCLGTGLAPSFTSASTKLDDEVGRKVVSDSSYEGNIAYIDFFFASGDIPDDTYTEWMTVIDGTASLNTGQAFSLLATGGWSKTGSIYISSKYTIV